ncbi:MAG: hypothetical protein AAF986_03295 [Pseudomonadota bacterium]
MLGTIVIVAGGVASSLADVPQAIQSGTWDVGASVGVDVRTFVESPQYGGQFETFQPSVTIEPDIRWETVSGDHQFVFTGFARIDSQDDERTHVDVREGYYRFISDGYEVLVGAAKVFWGVTESRHLVDIINQTDAVESIDEEDKLGQPMAKLSVFTDLGQLDLFVLPYFRERTFPGRDGRLRFDPPVKADEAIYEDSNEEWAPSFAARYSHYIGSWDFSLNAFHGTSREPRVVPRVVDNTTSLVPFYDRITQVGATAQYTNDAWLWKFEGIVREGQGDTFGAAVAGVEYTFFGVNDKGADLGVLVEYLYDGRDQETLAAPPTPQEDDIFVGTRYTLNDTQDTAILAGLVTDLDDAAIAGLVEAERRIGENWTTELEARFFVNTDENLLSAFRKDSHLTFRLKRYF